MELSFEEEAQKAKGYPRLIAFNKRYGVNYPVLLAGEQADLAEKVPQIHNLNSFPTTIFLGRDGLVRGVHAGFAGAASGAFHDTREGRDHGDGRAAARGKHDDAVEISLKYWWEEIDVLVSVSSLSRGGAVR